MMRRLFLVVLFAGLVIGRPGVRLELPAVKGGESVIEYTGYCVSYDPEKRIPRWVAYELTAEEAVATVAVKNGKNFRQDPSVKLPQAEWNDYRGSGWSRGHMAPAADFKWDDKALWDTFYYTNCCPQNARLNNGPWNVLENKVRFWARKYGRIYVVTGPVIREGRRGRLGANEVVIPDAFFKALLVPHGKEFSAIGFVMENTDDPQSLKAAHMTIDALESVTGIDFFPSLKSSVEKAVESRVDHDVFDLR